MQFVFSWEATLNKLLKLIFRKYICKVYYAFVHRQFYKQVKKVSYQYIITKCNYILNVSYTVVLKSIYLVFFLYFL